VSTRPRRPRAAWLRRPLVVCAVIAGGAGLAAVAITSLDLSRSLHALTHVRPPLVAATFALLAVSVMCRAECWYVILRGARISAQISRRVSARATMIGVMVSATLPGRLGEPARAFVVARHAGGTRSSLALVAGTVLAQTLLNMAALVVLASALVSSITVFRGAVWAIALAAAIPFAAVAVIVTGPRLLDRAARRRTAVGRAAALVRTEVANIRGGLRVFIRPRDALHAGAAQIGAWVLQLLACYALLAAFRIATPSGLGAAAAVLVATNVAAVLPVTPGNVGVFQAACVAALAAYGVDAGRALAYGVALQLLEVTTAVALGLPALLAEGLRPHDLRRATQRAADPGGVPGVPEESRDGAPASPPGSPLARTSTLRRRG
jgi:phosphatidylinositol alpha-mannosyltransferase